LSGQRFGRPKSDPYYVAEENKQFLDDQHRRNAVEGKIGQGKWRFGLAFIREKLSIAQGSTIALNAVVTNLENLVELLFILLSCWRQLHMALRAARKSQMAQVVDLTVAV